MFRKTLLALSAVMVLGSVAASTSASAYWRGGGFHRGYYGGGFHRGFGFYGGGFRRGFGFYGRPYYGGYGFAGCVRRVWTPYGFRLRRVC